MSENRSVVWVTGASQGIGLAIARAFAQGGYPVVLSSRRADVCEKLAAELSQTYKVDAMGVGLDVTDAARIDQTVDRVKEKMGRIDVLVNNAGIARDNLLIRMSDEEWAAVIDANLTSVFRMTRSVLRPMLRQKYGRIINISSVIGLMGNAGQANYAAAKAGIIGFSKTVAREYAGKGIRCNVIAPGFVQTDMIGSLPDEQVNHIMNQLPIKRLGKPEEIANLCLFFASELADYITGQVLAVDGGMTI